MLLAVVIVVLFTGPAEGDWKRGLRHGTIAYSLFVPDPNPGRPLPVVTFLHGVGSRGSEDNVWNHPDLALYSSDLHQSTDPCYVVAPVCPANDFWPCRGSVWPNANPIDGESISRALNDVLEVIRGLCDTASVDRNRLYLIGGSMGGYGTWEAIARFPQMFAAAVPIAGGGDVSMASVMTDIAVWAIHGINDGTVPLIRSKEMVDAIVAAGGKRVRHTWIAGTGHLWDDAEEHVRCATGESVRAWLFGQSRTPAALQSGPPPMLQAVPGSRQVTGMFDVRGRVVARNVSRHTGMVVRDNTTLFVPGPGYSCHLQSR